MVSNAVEQWEVDTKRMILTKYNTEIMKQIIFAMLALFAWATSLPAQTTREQADAIVLDYLKNAVTLPCLLYVNDNAPSEKGTIITTSNEETFKVQYACWAYYLNISPDPDEYELDQSRYFFVKEDNGNLLEVIAYDDLGPEDLTSWKAVGITTGLTKKEDSVKLLYPNPVDDWLSLPCSGEPVRVEIYDLKGTRLFAGLLSGEDTCRLDASFLSAGVYIVSVSGEMYKIIKN